MNTFYDRQKRKEEISEIKLRKKKFDYVFDKSKKEVNKRQHKLSTVEIAEKQGRIELN